MWGTRSEVHVLRFFLFLSFVWLTHRLTEDQHNQHNSSTGIDIGIGIGIGMAVRFVFVWYARAGMLAGS